MKRKYITLRVITLLLLGFLAPWSLYAEEGLPIVRSVDSALLNQAPETLSLYLYDAADAVEPVRIKHLHADQWQADVDLQAWPLAQERAVRFRAVLGGLEALNSDAPLWVEMEVDGVPVGERSPLVQAVPGGGGISTVGMVESRSGGFKFPDGSIQTTAGGGGSGTVTSITAGSGLTGDTITSAGTIGVDSSLIQSRVSGSCEEGLSIRSIATDGTVICETDDLGATTGDLDDHAALSSVHHSRYADTDAVTAIKAADGTGSMLDADLLDGLHASEVIASAVAQSAVATPISSLPYTISQSGSYYVTGNLDGSAGGIDITTRHVTLDLMGFTLDGGGAVEDHGIFLSGVQENVTIKNGTVRRFGYSGITQSGGGSFSRYMKVINVRSLDNGDKVSGFIGGHGIEITARNSFVIGCIAGGNKGSGIAVGNASVARNNTVYGNGRGTGATFNGIFAGYGSLVIGNTVHDHLKETSNSAAIKVSSSSVVRNNTVYFNNSWGISCSGCRIKDNSVTYNNGVNNSSSGGIAAEGRSLVAGNTVLGNKQNGIVVKSTGNVLRDNHITGSNPGVGIRFLSSSNYYRDNIAYDNGTDFVATGVNDGGGNVGF